MKFPRRLCLGSLRAHTPVRHLVKIIAVILDPRHKNMCSVCFDKKITPSSSSYVYFDHRVQHHHPGSDQFKSSLSNCLWLCSGSLWEPGNEKHKISFLDPLSHWCQYHHLINHRYSNSDGFKFSACTAQGWSEPTQRERSFWLRNSSFKRCLSQPENSSRVF